MAHHARIGRPRQVLKQFSQPSVDLGVHFALVGKFMMFRLLVSAPLLFLLSGSLHAQFSSNIQCFKKNHLLGEPVMVRVSLTNHTGREQILQGSRLPWITFLVKTSNGNPVHTHKNSPDVKPIRIAAGQTLAKDFNLNQYFLLNQEGNYSVSAVIRPPDGTLEGASTQRAAFELHKGTIYWSQKVGSIGPANSTRDFRVIQFRDDAKTGLYVQIEDVQSARVIQTARLGDALMMRKPTCTVDSEQHMHVLFLTNPNTWFHYRVSPDGEIVTADMHRRAAVGDPKLSVLAGGMVAVTNSILYDPKAAAEERAKIRRITDRP